MFSVHFSGSDVHVFDSKQLAEMQRRVVISQEGPGEYKESVEQPHLIAQWQGGYQRQNNAHRNQAEAGSEAKQYSGSGYDQQDGEARRSDR